MSPAASDAQKRFFGLVRAVQKGDVPKNKVTSNVRDAAKDTSPEDTKDMANTDTKNLPDRIVPKSGDAKSDDDGNDATTDEGVNFPHIVGRFNEYGKMLKQNHSLVELSQQLSDIAEYAEYTLTNEMTDSYDAFTIKRNIKEMRGYAKEFSKIAEEADSHNLRMNALYDDMGRVLERYFDIFDDQEINPQQSMAEYDDDDPPHVGSSAQDRAHDERRDAELIKMHDPKPSSTIKKEQIMSLRKELAERAVRMVRGRLRGESLIKFDTIPENTRAKLAWRILR